MSIVVYNKDTGKYLNQHSGSYNRYITVRLRYSTKVRNHKFRNPKPENMYVDSPERDAYRKEYKAFIDKLAFASYAGNSRRYHSKSSAITSVGNYSKCGMQLPDNLELHEIEVERITIKRR
jgi:hypothetical protein